MHRRKIRKGLYEKYQQHGECCFYCKEPVAYPQITLDHFLPKIKGFKLFNNRLFSCLDCNNIKSDLDIYTFRKTVVKRLIMLYKQRYLRLKASNALKNHPLIRRYVKIIKTCDEIIEGQMDVTSVLF